MGPFYQIRNTGAQFSRNSVNTIPSTTSFDETDIEISYDDKLGLFDNEHDKGNLQHFSWDFWDYVVLYRSENTVIRQNRSPEVPGLEDLLK